MACTVGKPMSCGGVINYDKTLAEGLVFILNLFLNNTNILSKLHLEGGLSGKTYIIQVIKLTVSEIKYIGYVI